MTRQTRVSERNGEMFRRRCLWFCLGRDLWTQVYREISSARYDFSEGRKLKRPRNGSECLIWRAFALLLFIQPSSLANSRHRRTAKSVLTTWGWSDWRIKFYRRIIRSFKWQFFVSARDLFISSRARSRFYDRRILREAQNHALGIRSPRRFDSFRNDKPRSPKLIFMAEAIVWDSSWKALSSAVEFYPSIKYAENRRKEFSMNIKQVMSTGMARRT